MDGTSFLTLAGPTAAELKVRASRFVAFASPATDEREAQRVLDTCSRQNHDARHHCAAWRFRNGNWRTVDAGEPSGSAGPPILSAIDSFGLIDVAVVVSRYFGGTKLGIGGLARAYGDAASAVLSGAPKSAGEEAVAVRIAYEFRHTGAIMRSLELADAWKIEHRFAEDGQTGIVIATIVKTRVGTLEINLREMTAGAANLEAERELILYRPITT